MQPTCFQIAPADTVATLLDDAPRGALIPVIGAEPRAAVTLNQAIARGHKVALTPMRTGESVVKYGIPVARTTRPIERGDWVHLHNCASGLDERSANATDPSTGLMTDVKYE
jgi:hypothetical protein